jgi:glycosyltransferase involved in cell wall biosynthesis
MSSIDVVVPCYRYGRYLHECVRSVLDQEGVALRVLVIDDASPDDTAEVGRALADADPRVTFVRHTINQGHIPTYNEGIEWASADYMLLLSADDYLLSGALQRAIDLMDRHPDMAFSFGDAIALSDDGSIARMSMKFDHSPAKRCAAMSGIRFIQLCIHRGAANIVPTPTAVVRTIVQKQAGGYLPELPHCGDLEMWLSLAARGAVGYLNADQAVYRRHASNMSLAYAHDNILRDLHQRQAAIDAFLLRSIGQLHGTDRLHRRLLQALGYEAVGQASVAFNRNNTVLSEEIRAFALSVHPRVNRTLGWNMLLVKRLLGPRISRTLLPFSSMLRFVRESLIN